jgi:phosphoribosyl 1,2-cyclic phosphate phosphodiesterase
MAEDNDYLSITLLGTGTSVGVPAVGCGCAVCVSTDPRNRRLRSSIYVATPECRWVVDTGPDFREQCLRQGIRALDAALFTHEHSDHVMGFDDLRRFSQGLEARLPVYATDETLQRLKEAFRYAFDQKNWHAVYVKPVEHRIGGPFQLGETRVVPLELRHAGVRTIGYLFERQGRRLAAYLPDVKDVEPEAMDLLQGVECLIVDGTSLRSLPTHISVDEAVALHRAVRAKQSWLTHLCHDVDHARVEGSLEPGVRIAYDGLKLQLV